jgi:hypothetical protein
LVLLIAFDIMTTFHLKTKERTLERFMEMLEQFEPSDIELISENVDFSRTKAELAKDLQASEHAKPYTVEEVDQILEDVIATYEGRTK